MACSQLGVVQVEAGTTVRLPAPRPSSAPRRTWSGLYRTRREGVDTRVAGFLTGDLDQLLYDTALCMGWLIAAAPIEGAYAT
ncbi:hypothetical protein ACIBU0_33355 [Streptomyces sp. NPDC049627]|uniref:hypothetical protein n=1 Tax=Streptomyces sp. NPDC049627 TaxID=3365595 RepID=UPI00379980EB